MGEKRSIMDIRKLNSLPIKAYLASRGVHPAKDRAYYGMYLSPLREERTPSMKVDYRLNLWIDFGLNEGGTMADLVMRLEKCTFREALRKLEQHMGGGDYVYLGGRDSPAPHARRQEPAITVVRVKPLAHPALVHYLGRRGIDVHMAGLHCPEVHYSIGGRRYYAVGFQNDSGGYELRSRHFKGSTSKDATSIHSSGLSCLVFEGFMDYLSYLTLRKRERAEQSVVVLNSVANLHRALEFIRTHGNVWTFLDNDKAGRDAVGKLLQACGSLDDQSGQYAAYKDLNDYLRNAPDVERALWDSP